jgi:hypothetical protein
MKRMKTKIQTDKRIVTYIGVDLPEDTTYDDVEKFVKERGIPFDGILLEMNSHIAYLWEKKRPVAPMSPAPPPLDAIRA